MAVATMHKRRSPKGSTLFMWKHETAESCAREIISQQPKPKKARRNMICRCFFNYCKHRGFKDKELYRVARSGNRYAHEECIQIALGKKPERPELKVVEPGSQISTNGDWKVTDIAETNGKHEHQEQPEQIEPPRSLNTPEELQRYLGTLEGRLEVYDKLFANIDAMRIMELLAGKAAEVSKQA